jgi:adenylate cyclase
MPTVERTFVFADLSGFTALTEAHGDDDAAAVAMRFAALARMVLEPGGQLVKTIGDAIMFAFTDPAGALRVVASLRAAVDREQGFPGVRVGLHHGSAVAEGGDYFGAAVNLAARVAAHAATGETLCTASVVGDVDGLPDIRFRPREEVSFKNISSPVMVYQVVFPEAEPLPVDSVCRMRVAPSDAAPRIEHGGVTYFFCSDRCAEIFRVSAERFVPPPSARRAP